MLQAKLNAAKPSMVMARERQDWHHNGRQKDCTLKSWRAINDNATVRNDDRKLDDFDKRRDRWLCEQADSAVSLSSCHLEVNHIPARPMWPVPCLITAKRHECRPRWSRRMDCMAAVSTFAQDRHWKLLDLSSELLFEFTLAETSTVRGLRGLFLNTRNAKSQRRGKTYR